MTPVQEQQLLVLLEQGLPLAVQPYLVLAEQIQVSEQQVLDRIKQWQAEGLFRRFGIVVKHRALGINANCMLVLDIPDEQVDAVGKRLGNAPGVNLCYRRPRRDNWPYNLFCMVHGRCREAVEKHIYTLLCEYNLNQYSYHLLFSTRAFKQRGARYSMLEARHD